MRTALSFFGFLVFALGLYATPQTFTASVHSLSGWSLVGVDPSALSAMNELRLPSNAQLARQFPASDIAVQLTTQPVLGENVGDWPVLELGSAALIFTRSGITGRFVLVRGDEAPLELPLTFALDADGRSREVLTLGFSRAGATLTVTLADQSLNFPAGPDDGGMLEIIASAGAAQPWALSRLAATVNMPEPVSSSAPAVFHAPPPLDTLAILPAVATATVTAVIAPLPRTPSLPVPSAFIPVSSTKVAAALVTTSSGGALEIYTPPSVRHGRVGILRAVIQSKSSN